MVLDLFCLLTASNFYMSGATIRDSMRVIKTETSFRINCNCNGTRFNMSVVFQKGYGWNQNVTNNLTIVIIMTHGCHCSAKV
jgi:hypothetical protein